MKKNIWCGILAVVLFSGFIACTDNLSVTEDFSIDENLFPDKAPAVVIVSPYSGVDWSGYGQYKAALHAHTTNSDGSNMFRQVIEYLYENDYDIAAITDHNAVTADWVSVRYGLKKERFDEIAAGEGRGGRGMLQIPYTNEQSESEHIGTYFVNYNNPQGISLKDNLAKVDELGGISMIVHPGSYTGGRVGGTAGENASNDPRTVQKYVDLFMEFSSCAGMEIINRKDGESASDRILWDNILAQTIPQGRYVWGFSNDDSHSNSEIGYSFNVFVMPENTLENFKAAMFSGSFYAVAKIAKRELDASFTATYPVPVITNIAVDDAAASITITAENCGEIIWISNGKVIAFGNTIKLKDHKSKICSYVRANLISFGGVAFTQPFGIIWDEPHRFP